MLITPISKTNSSKPNSQTFMDSQGHLMSHIHALRKEIETLKKPLARLHETAPSASLPVNEVSYGTQSPGDDEF